MGCDCDMQMKSVKNYCILMTQHNSPHPDTGQVMTLVLTQYLKNINLTDRMSDYIPGDHQCVYTGQETLLQRPGY